MPATVPITAFSGAAPPWSLLALDGNFTAIQSALANPQIGVSVTSDSGGVNALIATPTPAWPSYVSGTPITVIPANTNTGNVSLNVSGLGARSVLNPDGSQLLPGALQAGTPYLFMTGTSTFVLLGSSLVQATQGPGGTPFALRNRLIDGDFRVDQRNAGGTVAVNNTNSYTMDRWQSYCGLGVGTGLLNVTRINFLGPGGGNPYAYQGAVGTAKASLSAGDFCLVRQAIEGLNIADLLFGTSSAKAITISFTFVTSIANAVLPVVIRNGSQNRSYVTSITTGTAGTAGRYSVTIPGDTTGTWATDNTIGLDLIFNWGSGSTFQVTANTWSAGNFLTVSGATNFMGSVSNTWQLTDVQLEAGPVATPFERIGFDMQLARCMRYYEKSFDYATAPAQNAGPSGCVRWSQTLTAVQSQGGNNILFKVTKRIDPPIGTFLLYNPSAANGQPRNESIGADCSGAGLFSIGQNSANVVFTTAAASAQGQSIAVHWVADAEL